MPNPRRRWFQFSLRTLLIAVTVASFAGSWLGQKVWAARRQKQSVEVIQKLGGIVGYDYQMDAAGNYNNLAQPQIPAWLRNACGDDLFADVNYVFMCGARATDETLPNFAAIPKLKSLNISHTKITDDGLANLRALKDLVELRISNTKVTDEGLRHLSGLTKLRELNLHRTKVTAAGLQHLVGLIELEELDVDSTAVSEAEFERLRKTLPKLKKNF